MNQDKFSTAICFISGSTFLLISLSQFSLALTWRPLDNQFLGGVLGIPIAFLFTLLFGAGWWLGWLFEKVFLSKGRNVALSFLFGMFLIYLVIMLVAFLTPLGLFRFAFVSGEHIAFSGFWFQLSRISYETLAKIRNRI